MNDQINNNTKPKNIKELFKMILKIVNFYLNFRFLLNNGNKSDYSII